MESLSTGFLFFILIVCLCISAFFSASETAMMSLNRYRLKHWVDNGNPAAKRVDALLKNTDKLLGTILLGNNFVNILATSVGTILGMRFFGSYGVLISTIALTVLILVFAEVAPKTVAAVFSERIALFVSRLLRFCVVALSPLVYLLNGVISLFLRPFGLNKVSNDKDMLSTEELKTIVLSSSSPEDSKDREEMLISVLELEDASVDEVMVPRNEIFGLDLSDDWQEIVAQIHSARFNRLLVYRERLDQVEGVLDLRDVLRLYHENRFDFKGLISVLRPCVFVPEHTLLRQQLLNFRQQKERSGVVVDEYGDIQGLITLEDILSHIVGDIRDNQDSSEPEIVKISEMLYEVDGGISLRSLNRALNLKLPLDGPNTLSGLIIENLGNFPEVGTVLAFDGCQVRVLDFADGVVEKVELKILPQVED